MKKYITILLFICFSSHCIGQINELGVFIGGTNYVGDVGSTNYIKPSDAGIGLIYKWNYNPRIAFRGTLTYLGIKGDDKYASNEVRQARGFNFSNRINEIALGMEFNFFEYDLASSNKTQTPYILIELAAFNYQRVNDISSNGTVSYTDKSSVAIPFGIGYKSKIYGKLAMAIEARFRYTFEDDLDYTTAQFPSLNFGGKSKDWYMFTGVSLVYTFGRPACYSDRR